MSWLGSEVVVCQPLVSTSLQEDNSWSQITFNLDKWGNTLRRKKINDQDYDPFNCCSRCYKTNEIEFLLDCMRREAFQRRWCLNWNLNNVHTQRKVYPNRDRNDTKTYTVKETGLFKEHISRRRAKRYFWYWRDLMKVFYTGHGKHLGFYSTSNNKLLEDLKKGSEKFWLPLNE